MILEISRMRIKVAHLQVIAKKLVIQKIGGTCALNVPPKSVSLCVYQMTIWWDLIMYQILLFIHWFTLPFFLVYCLDVSSNQVTFRIQEQWDQKYSDPTTNEYINLKQQIVDEVNLINQCFLYRDYYFL